MKKLMVLGAGAAISAAAASAALFGAGVAGAAPDVVGETYADAVSASRRKAALLVVANRVGGKLEQGECIVTARGTHRSGDNGAGLADDGA